MNNAVHTLVVAACVLLSVGCSSASKPGPTSNAPKVRSLSDHSKQPASALEGLDAAIRAQWDASGNDIAMPLDDDGFLRRATLDLIGRVPTAAERAHYLNGGSHRRSELVDTLLASDEYATYWSLRLHDLLFDKQLRNAARFTAPARMWLKQQLRANRPWNELVYEMLTATGDLEYEASTSFLITQLHFAKLGGLTSTVSDRLLGVQLACAQCHDHPYQPWTQRDFWALAAGFSEATVRSKGVSKLSYYRLEDKTARKRSNTTEDGLETAVVAPKLLGRPVIPSGEQSPREAMASAIIDHELFAEAAVGRIWTDLLGRGLVDPWNDLQPEKSRSEVLALLAQEFRRSNHDLRALFRLIVSSEAYNRSSRGASEGRAQAEATFARAMIRPLNAYQVHRSLLTVTGLGQAPTQEFQVRVRARRDDLERKYRQHFEDGVTRNAADSSVEVAQFLGVLNDGFAHYGTLAHHGGVLDRILRAHQDPNERAKAVYALVLARSPTAAELDEVRELAGEFGAPAAYEDLMYALLNSAEFLTNH